MSTLIALYFLVFTPLNKMSLLILFYHLLDIVLNFFGVQFIIDLNIGMVEENNMSTKDLLCARMVFLHKFHSQVIGKDRVGVHTTIF